jgi:hypothetical protein
MMNLMILRLVLLAIVIAAFVPPAVKILRRMGFSGWWVLIAVISPLNIVALWVLAYAKWPAMKQD